MPLAARCTEIATIRAIEAARSDKLRGPPRAGRHGNGRTAMRRKRRRFGAIERTAIARTLGVSRVYARDLTRGKVPHPRHFAALAQLTGAEMPMLVGG
jgi:hypothetical protein